MNGLNLEALRNDSEAMGSSIFLNQKDLKESGTDFRIDQGSPSLNGKYYLEVVILWLAGKKYVSPKTFGLPDPFEKELDAIRATPSSDRDARELKALADAVDLKKQPKVQYKIEYWVPGRIVNVSIGANNVLESAILKECKILSAGKQLTKSINDLIMSRASLSNGSPWGMLDYEKGANVVLTKKGSGLNTEYKAELGDQFAVPPQQMNDCIDVYAYAKAVAMTGPEMQKIADAYFYGEGELPSGKNLSSEDLKKVTRGHVLNTGNARSDTPQEPSEPTRARRAAAASSDNEQAPAPSTARRRLSDRLGD